MQPFSRPESALEVKSSTQAVKQLSTRPPKSWVGLVRVDLLFGSGRGEGRGEAYIHELFDLALL